MSSVMVAHSESTNEYNNNHSLLLNNNEASPEELALLAKLEEANRLIEADAKSLNSISNNSGHSRKSSDTSQISLTSGKRGGNKRRKINKDLSVKYVKGTSSSVDRNCAEDGEEDLWSIWGRVVNDWDTNYKKKTSFTKELARKGVPHHFRGIVWPLLCGAHDSPVKKQYAEYIKATSACEKVIRRDIARTYPEHDFFKEKDGLGQESLFNVMKAYSLHDREVGYCQGSGFIVGLLLMQMPEEEAFAVLVKLMQDYKMRDMFKPTMAELGLCMYQLENLVQELIPDLHVHFQSQSFHTSMYASSWFLTLFTTALALPTACRVIDVFLLEGMEIIFKVALALLFLGKEDLLCLDMEGMLKFFQKDLPPRADADPEALMQVAYNVKFNQKRMKKLEKEYTVMKTKEQEEMVELRRLRSENRLLRQRVELLEAESSELADRLVRGQVSRAEEEETTFVVQRELAALRHTHLEASHQLELAQEEIRNLSLKIEQNDNSCQSSLEEICAKRELLNQKEEMVKCLQDQLVKERLRQAENDALIRDLRARIQELEEMGQRDEAKQELLHEKDGILVCLQDELVKERLRQAENEALVYDLRAQIHELEEDKKTLRESTVDNSVAHLQEELIAVKLREAEANLSLKELRQRVSELGAQWQRHLQEHRVESPPAPDSTPKKIGNMLGWESRSHETQRLQEELMTTRVKEIEAITELKELRLRVMELETQVQVSGNQLRRQDQDIKQLREDLEQAATREKEQAAKFREQQHRYTDLESKMKDDLMMARIRDAEHAQLVAELRQKISRLELKTQEMVAEGELRSHLDDSEKVRELQDKMAEMKAEIMRLESWKQRWTEGGGGTMAATRSGSVDTESEHDEPSDFQICLNNDASSPEI